MNQTLIHQIVVMMLMIEVNFCRVNPILGFTLITFKEVKNQRDDFFMLKYDQGITNRIEKLQTAQVEDFEKSRAMLASVVYLPSCLGANLPKVCELLIFICKSAKGMLLFKLPCHCANMPKAGQVFNLMCQRAKGLPIIEVVVPTCQKACQFFNFACQKAYQFFNYLSK